MPLDQNALGDRGETIATLALTEFHGDNPLFRVVFLGEKFPVSDLVLELWTHPGHIFMAQVKSSQSYYKKTPRLKITFPKAKFNKLANCPLPTYVIGVDTVGSKCFIGAAASTRTKPVHALQTTYDLGNPSVREGLRDEVLAFWNNTALKAPWNNSNFMGSLLMDAMDKQRAVLLTAQALEGVPGISATTPPRSDFDILARVEIGGRTDYFAVQVLASRSLRTLLDSELRLRDDLAADADLLRTRLVSTLLVFCVDVRRNRIRYCLASASGKPTKEFQADSFAATLPQLKPTSETPPSVPLSGVEVLGGLRSAAKIVASTSEDRFVVSPVERELLGSLHDSWFEETARQLASGMYQPSPAPLVRVPVRHWRWRPGRMLTLRDRIVYTFLGLTILPTIEPTLRRSAETHSFARHLRDDREHRLFIREFHGWRNFDRVALGQLAAGEDMTMAVTDIASFYENISIPTVLRMLQADGVDEAVVSLLGRLLDYWEGYERRGLPQSEDTSHLLAEYLLAGVDEELASADFITRHLRYVDDFRLFCTSEEKSHRALYELSHTLRGMGLNLQPTKTRVLGRETAQMFVKERRTRLLQAAKAIAEDPSVVDEFHDPSYPTPMRIANVVRSWTGDGHALDLALTKAWHRAREADQDSTTIHFLLNRLAVRGTTTVFPEVMDLLGEQPEDYAPVMQYLAAVVEELEGDQLQRIADFLGKDHQVYGFVQLKIVEVLVAQGVRSRVLDDTVLSIAESGHPAAEHALVYAGNAGHRGVAILQRVLNGPASEAKRATALFSILRVDRPGNEELGREMRHVSPLFRQAVEAAEMTRLWDDMF